MKITTKEITIIGIFAAITAILGPRSLPTQPIPITLQVFAVSFSAVVLGSKCGTLSQIIYVLLGILGLPVFSNFKGGWQVILGPTGGYIFGFLIMTFIVGLLIERKQNVTKLYLLGVLSLGLVICYTLGVLQLSFVTKTSLLQAIKVGALLPLPLDLLKIGAASFLGHEVRKSLIKANFLSSFSSTQ